MKKNTLITITCPYCGYEYLPEEIFVPNGFFGKPKGICRTTDGKIEWFIGKSIDGNEIYTCDKCNSRFLINSRISFQAQPIKEYSDETIISRKISSNIYLTEK